MQVKNRRYFGTSSQPQTPRKENIELALNKYEKNYMEKNKPNN